MTVFNAEDCSERTFVPFPVKEACVKGAFLMTVVHMWNMVTPVGALYGFAQMSVVLSQSYTIFNLMTKAVTRIDLHSNGKEATFHLGKVGRTQTVNIKDIVKLENEKSLVETFEESSMFPLQVGKDTFYVNGPG